MGWDMEALVEASRKFARPPNRGVNKVLVAFAFGSGVVIDQDLDGAVEEFVRENGGVVPYCLDRAGVDYDGPIGDRICVADLRVVDDGPGDWPGSREAAARLDGIRPATEEEWRRFREGEWIWDQPEEKP